jgi:hypothetical protein
LWGTLIGYKRKRDEKRNHLRGSTAGNLKQNIEVHNFNNQISKNQLFPKPEHEFYISRNGLAGFLNCI